MARDRNNVIKRSDEDGWQDFKDGANKNKEDGIEIKEKKKGGKLQFSGEAEEEGGASLEAASENGTSVFKTLPR